MAANPYGGRTEYTLSATRIRSISRGKGSERTSLKSGCGTSMASESSVRSALGDLPTKITVVLHHEWRQHEHQSQHESPEIIVPSCRADHERHGAWALGSNELQEGEK